MVVVFLWQVDIVSIDSLTYLMRNPALTCPSQPIA